MATKKVKKEKTIPEVLFDIRTELRKTPYTLPSEGPVSVQQVARWLQCSDSTVYRLVVSGVMPRIHRIGTSDMMQGGLSRMDATECWEHYHQHLEPQKNRASLSANAG